jgi:hypothetical protein
MARKYAVTHHPIPTEGVVQLDDSELACRLAEAAIGRKRPFKLSEDERRFFNLIATAAVDYFEERAEAAVVRYA